MNNKIKELREQSEELINSGDSHDKSEGYGMWKVLDALSNPKAKIGKRIKTIGELREVIADFKDSDTIFIEGLDTDLYPMYVDAIELFDNANTIEVRFCQMPNA